jgi:hypothetical protein
MCIRWMRRQGVQVMVVALECCKSQERICEKVFDRKSLC